VLIGRRAALAADFADMTRQFDAAIRRVHAGPHSGQENRQESKQGSGQETGPATGSGVDAPLHKASSPENRREARHTTGAPRSGPRNDEHKSR
jgi:hypothetical protein